MQDAEAVTKHVECLLQSVGKVRWKHTYSLDIYIYSS